jgi:dipeptidyl-peptidase-4
MRVNEEHSARGEVGHRHTLGVTSPASSKPSFPRQRARTRNFTSGAPRGFRVDPTGMRVLFLRSAGPNDPVAALWRYDVDTQQETLLADPHALLADDHEDLPPAERARRERAREGGAGVVAYATDQSHDLAAFVLSGRLFTVDVLTGEVTELPTAGPAFDPRPDPRGERIAYIANGALRVVDRAGNDICLATDDDANVSWGVAEFVAAEEMDRMRGYWWTPDGNRVVAARVDENPVLAWHVADPANPEQDPLILRYPRAGTANADVTVHILDMTGGRVDISWDRAAFPYVVGVQPTKSGCLLVVQTRDQRVLQALDVDMSTGRTDVVHEQTDERWVTIVREVPARLADGKLVTVADVDDSRRLCIDGELATPPGWQVCTVHVYDDELVVTASEDPTQQHVWLVSASRDAQRLTHEAGVHAAVRGGSVTVIASASMDHHGTRVTVHRDGQPVGDIASYAEEPVLTPTVTFLTAGARELRTAVVMPSGHERGQRLPVLLDPYGGPLDRVGRVARTRSAHLNAQWFADQGFIVVAVDGRGTWGRGPAWERAIADDWSGAVLDDQVEALHAVASSVPDMDLSRVGIRGWSFGGYLAALAVLRRPDVFHAAVAGAPVTDWTLYDTHYTERYLGDPTDDAKRYAAASLLDDAPKLTRPLLLIHGLADDNVVAAHTLRLSGALLAAGRPHSVLPLSGVTHMTSHETVEENMLQLQVAFLHDALSRAPSQESAG